MGDVTKICIGVQARSTSSRLPDKIFKSIGGKAMVYHVLAACDESARYVTRHSNGLRDVVSTHLLMPEGDPGLKEVRMRTKVPVITGPEHDVLERYRILAETFRADYIVRVTADCPLLPSPLITKHIRVAVGNQADYVSNVDEALRLSPDGFDVEVMSRGALDWLCENAKTPEEREHVTLKLRREAPNWMSIHHVMSYLDQSHLKLSVDTEEDLERVRALWERRERAMKAANERNQPVHRY